MQTNTQAVAPAAPAVAPAAPVTPTTPVATPLIAILAQLEDSCDPHVCPFFPSEELLFRKDAKALAAIGDRRSIRAQWSAQSRDDIALITNVSGRCIGWVGDCSIT